MTDAQLRMWAWRGIFAVLCAFWTGVWIIGGWQLVVIVACICALAVMAMMEKAR